MCCTTTVKIGTSKASIQTAAVGIPSRSSGASPAKKIQLLKEYRERKKICQKAVKVSSEIGESCMPLPNAADESYCVTPKDATDAIARSKYGSGESATARSLLQNVLKSDPTALVVKSNTQISPAATIKSTQPDPIPFTTSQTAQLSLSISPQIPISQSASENSNSLLSIKKLTKCYWAVLFSARSDSITRSISSLLRR